MSSTTGPRYAAGQSTATNAELLIENVGFVPEKICVTNLTNSVRVTWCKGQIVGANLKFAAAGDLTVITGGVEPYTPATGHYPGIKIPVLTDINDTPTEVLLWEAWG